MGHSKSASRPSWLAIASKPPPGPFTLSALDAHVETTAFKGRESVQSLVAYFPVVRKSDFLAGDLRTPPGLSLTLGA